MKPHKLTPMLWTENVESTIKFYTEKLKFICGEKNEDWNWASLFNEEVEIMIAKPNAHTPFKKPIFTGSLYFKVENVDKLWNDLKDQVKIAYQIENFEWEMREFAIYDNNGYLLQFGEDIKKQPANTKN